MCEKIVVDPKLFITCRLCLDELGIYQIVPTVKDQISFCFGINVEPFDGLPQLICKKCEGILNGFDSVKKSFVTKQNELIAKIRGSSNRQLLSEDSPPRTLEQNHKNDKPQHRASFSKKRRRISSSSESDNDTKSKPEVTNFEDNQEDSAKSDESWKLIYDKEYVCRVCDKHWNNSKAVKSHFVSRHYGINRKFKQMFQYHCKVKLYSFDEKPNITGSWNHIVLDRHRIITKNDNSKYYIRYTPRYKNDVNDSPQSNKRASNVCSDASDDDSVGNNRNKKRRLYSRSSNETVVLDETDTAKESHETKTLLVNECINIDDSSESETEHDENKTRKDTVDINAVNDIILGCKNKHLKKRFHNDVAIKSNKNPNDIASSLKRKFLSVGRKIINNKKAVYCTPLLRFLEYKNLDITWQSQSLNSVTADSNYIRIMSRVKNSGENDVDEPGWIDYNYPNVDHDTFTEALTNVAPNFSYASKDTEKESRGTEEDSVSITLQNDSHLSSDTKKLLNENPVANPKQLPKKTVTEMKTIISNFEAAPCDDPMEMCMPIITSTTSLAPSVLFKDQNRPDGNTNATPEAPRIKVKSVTELMSRETLSRMQEPSDHVLPRTTNALLILPQNSFVNAYANSLKTNVSPNYQNAQVQANNYNAVQQEVNKSNNYVILDTTDLPNTKTNSPFDYFRRLLQLHNIVLLDIDVVPTQEFHCLLKFKVLFQQEPNKSVPVVLSLSLYCSKNLFLLTIKDRNQENINISKISANWQWEVLKVYTGAEVVERILNNAQKINPVANDYTNKFLCLLKSINYIKPL